MIPNKLSFEGALDLYSSNVNVIQPSDIYKAVKDESIRNKLIGCNVYLIVKRPKICIDSNNLRIEDNQIKGDLLVYSGNDYERFTFVNKKIMSQLDIKSVQAHDFPHNMIHVQTHFGETVSIPLFIFLTECEYDLEGNDDLEVLYVGHGIGKDENKLAIDRLNKHETLQRILADTLQMQPDYEILLLLFRYEHKKNILRIGNNYTNNQKNIDDGFNVVLNAKFERKNSVLLAEAALISYFKPRYNIIYKRTFPSKDHIILKKILEYDFTGLIVEIDTSAIKANLYTNHVAPPVGMISKVHPYTHIAKIPLHSQKERECFLNGYL